MLVFRGCTQKGFERLLESSLLKVEHLDKAGFADEKSSNFFVGHVSTPVDVWLIVFDAKKSFNATRILSQSRGFCARQIRFFDKFFSLKAARSAARPGNKQTETKL